MLVFFVAMSVVIAFTGGFALACVMAAAGYTELRDAFEDYAREVERDNTH